MTAKQAQHLLAYLGFYTLEIDGIWGPGSRGAMEAFQTRAGLPVTGSLDGASEQALKEAVYRGLPGKDFWEEIEYFTREEFRCKCGLYHAPYCDGFPAEPKEAMVRIAEAVRRKLEVPVTVISGLRCPRHNRDSGGVEESQHIYGEAADIRAQGVSARTLLDTVKAIPGVRYAYAINATNVHFDIEKGDR